jgi:hypothetical protein
MGLADQKQFTDAVALAESKTSLFFGRSWNDEWTAALNACNKLAMFDMLPALASLPGEQRRFLLTDAGRNPRAPLPTRLTPDDSRKRIIGEGGVNRIWFAFDVIMFREIEDHGLPEEQVNDGREFLGCTRLDDDGVRAKIADALAQAKSRGATGCCQVVGVAWTQVLVPQRRAFTGASLVANVAAAAHYMLARYHVCNGLASQRQMKIVVDGYDAQKRVAIVTGDRDMKSIALTPNNPPFPPDFEITNWAYKGADDGESDRLRCNSKASVNIIPKVNGKVDAVFAE